MLLCLKWHKKYPQNTLKECLHNIQAQIKSPTVEIPLLVVVQVKIVGYILMKFHNSVPPHSHLIVNLHLVLNAAISNLNSINPNQIAIK